ncbi:MAG: GatB/YqeY domain-containing protein [Oceanospirillaceae bacterium]|nr:GatB/YqeY domain-containing protein [Oceanospirillaceae bacterium]
MSAIQKRIRAEMKDAMRAKDKPLLSIIRMILAEFKRIEVDERIELDDTRALIVLDKMSKQRKDSLTQFKEANRTDLADIEQQELEVIKNYLPQPLSTNEITAIITSAITQSQVSSMADMGKVMALIKPQVQGRADMGIISKLVKQQLSS